MRTFLTLSLLTLFSCTKEKSTNIFAYIKNTTNHNIEIKPYSNGVVNNNYTINLLPNQEFQISNYSTGGLNNNGGFSSKYFDNSDSIRVKFDNINTITHYNINNPSLLNFKYYLNNSPRNMINFKNYTFSQKVLTKNQYENTYNFEFIEQDYLDAKP